MDKWPYITISLAHVCDVQRCPDMCLHTDYYAPAPKVGTLSNDARLISVWRLFVAYIGPKSRTERPRKTTIGTEVAHVTRDSDTIIKVKRSKVNLQRAGHIVAASHTACY